MELVSRHFSRKSFAVISVFCFSTNIRLRQHNSRLMLGSNKSLGPIKQLPLLRDLDQPFTLHIRLYDRPYRFEFYDTASPTNYTLLRPELIILCYSIADPESLRNVHTEWKTLVETHFNYDERLPVILLGLMRDIRQKEDYDGNVRRVESVGDGDQEPLNARRIVYPQEALKVAQEMRIDRYCECSARTGEVRVVSM